MSTLVEVDIETISQAYDHLALCQKRGNEVVDRLKSEKMTVKKWIFFEKEITMWDYYTGDYHGWHTAAYYAQRDGKITEHEARCVNLRNRSYDFKVIVEHGTRALLSTSDLRALGNILDTKLED
ncbi:hypothetical protein Hena1_01950 [Erwinia phage Hena1]|uniref:Uncharacterized protein n=1 Tax=Erwinia phage Hena1 TaxID=2678601 RepID=A0A6B9J601_9CAUD|nr:hypothetical protein HWC84_gp169 [Erwinia phage Hena1]QGZ16345.1 hypothetical protein Hena1_01950 [Erwinia phage Hena1]